MANSLKSMFPELGRVLDISPAALYAYQRAFVAAGILDSTPGRGPGSGVRASAETVAQFLIGLLTNASMEENIPFARALENARSADGTCPLTGAKTFHAALSRILSDESLAKRVSEIAVHMHAGQAAIGFDGGNADQDMNLFALKSRMADRGMPLTIKPAPRPVSVFLARKAPKEKGLRVSVSISPETVRNLTGAARKLLAKETAS